jgi:hypothetical protein
MAVLIAFMLFGSGCTSKLPAGHMETYVINRPLKIHVCDKWAMIRFNRAAHLPDYTYGFTDCRGEIWVRCDPWNPSLPYFPAFGHEVWHQEELGGRKWEQ